MQARIQSVKGIIAILVLVAAVVLALVGRLDVVPAILISGLAVAELVG